MARNTAWLMFGTVLQKALSFIVFYYIARQVGPTVTGKYFYAVSITSIFVVLGDFGLTPVIIREMASDHVVGRSVLAQALRLKTILIPVAVICSLVYAWVVKVEPEVFRAVLVACFVLSADTMSLLWYGVLRGKKDLRFEALGMLITQVVTAIIAVLAIHQKWGVVGLVAALLAGSVWNLVWSMWRVWSVQLTPLHEKHWGMKKLALAALPFGLAGLFVKVYSYIDSLLLRQFHGHEAVGQYAVAYKLAYALQFLPLTFVAALYPAMSSAYAAGNQAELKRSLKGALRLMMIVSVPLVAILSGLSEPIILTFYKKAYAGAIPVLTILPWVLIPIFLDFPVGSLLNASRRSMQKTIAMGCTMVMNAVLNVLLVPSMGPVGAAYSALVSFWMLFFIGVWFVRDELPEKRWQVFFLLRGLLVVGVSWVLIRWLTPVMPFVMKLLFSGALTGVFLFATRLLLVSDILAVIQWLKRRPSPPLDQVEDKGAEHA